MSKLGPIRHFPSPVSCDSLVLQGLRCEWGAGVLHLVTSLSHSLILTGHWKFNMAPHDKELSEDLKKRIVALHKDGLGYKKIAKTLKLSCSTVAKTIQRFNWTGSTQNRPHHGRPKKLSARAQHHIQWLSLGSRRMSAASIAAEVEGVGGQPVSAQTIRRTLHQIGLHGCRPRRKPILKMMHKKPRKQFAEDKQTKDIDYWNHVLWSDETKINLFGSDGVKRVWRQPGEKYKDKCVLPGVGSVMVRGCMSAAGTGELQFIDRTMNANLYCDILKQSIIPSLRRLGRRAVFQHDNDPKHTSKTTTALLKKRRVKVMDWPNMSPDLNPSVGHPQTEGGGVQGLEHPPAP
uniref:Transposase Tc1-like domain-containing protein n=1 Tax=Oncorhynchus tshawytscha TaxID=74940 RepID=A0AAZ3QU63_ONCTS